MIKNSPTQNIRALGVVTYIIFLLFCTKATEARLSVREVTSESVTLSWTAVGDDGLDGTASVYDIRYATFEITDSNWDSALQTNDEPTPQLAGAVETYTVNNLGSGTTYYFAIKVVDEADNWSGQSNVVTRTTQAANTPPSDIADLMASNPTMSSLTLSWTSPGQDADSGTATEYDIRYSTSVLSQNNWDSALQVNNEPTPQLAGGTESFEVTGLEPATGYFFGIKTADEVPNWSALSNITALATSGDQTPPAAITDLLAETGSGEGDVLIGWTAPGDDGDLGIVTGYMIRHSISAIVENNWDEATLYTAFPQPLQPGGEQSLILTGLVPGQLYYVAVRAFDESANLAPLSNAASAAAGYDLTVGVDDITTQVSPASGAVVPTARPLLSVRNISGETDRTYYFEVATDSGFINLADAGSVDEQDGTTTSWRVRKQLKASQIYYWRARTALSEYSNVSIFTVLPLSHAFPNPFVVSGADMVTFTDLPSGADLVLLSVSGTLIRRWTNLEDDIVVWDGTNQSGGKVASGTYLWYVTDAGPKGKLIVLR